MMAFGLLAVTVCAIPVVAASICAGVHT